MNEKLATEARTSEALRAELEDAKEELLKTRGRLAGLQVGTDYLRSVRSVLWDLRIYPKLDRSLLRHEHSKLKKQIVEKSEELKTIRGHLSSVLDEAQNSFDTTGRLTEQLRSARGKLAGLQVGTDYLR